MRCLLFPGQGVQRRGMGADVFRSQPALARRASEILGYSIEDLCVEDPDRRLRDTRYAQPAVFVVNALLHAEVRRTGQEFDLYSGHSLGEYNALVAAGVVTFDDALRVVARRGELMAQISEGAMFAVLDVGGSLIDRALRDAGGDRVFVANRNSRSQTTIAGERDQVAAVARSLRDLPGARVVPLNVSGPFHTPLMEPVAADLREVLDEVRFGPGSAPVVSSVTGGVFEPGRAAEILTDQVSRPVEWIRAVQQMRDLGAESFDEVNGLTLTGLLN